MLKVAEFEKSLAAFFCTIKNKLYLCDVLER